MGTVVPGFRGGGGVGGGGASETIPHAAVSPSEFFCIKK